MEVLGGLMTIVPLPSPLAKDVKAARSQFLELYGSLEVMNTYLKIAVLCLSLVCVGLVVLSLRTNANLLDRRPIVVGIDPTGRPQVLPYESVEYHPQEKEIKYFLIQFVQRHYSRIRATVKEDYASSLYFLEPQAADALIESNKNSKAIESFLAGDGEENDVKVTNVSIEDLRKPPYHATVEFEKVYFGLGHLDARREKYVANFLFIVRDRVPNNLIPVNPLGLTITYFREDQAFSR
jgi:type IV secretory pathway TrbF-like protein